MQTLQSQSPQPETAPDSLSGSVTIGAVNEPRDHGDRDWGWGEARGKSSGQYRGGERGWIVNLMIAMAM